MSPGKILIVDDDRELLRLLQLELEAFNHQVVMATDGQKALDLVESEKPDLVILDIQLPVMDGLSVCRVLRGKSMVPILMLSSRREDYDKIVGLELGADDYLGKPCNPRELVARVGALLRRSSASSSSRKTASPSLEAGCLKLNSDSNEAWDDGERLALTPIEFSLLEALMNFYERTLTREKLLELIWGPNFVGSARTVDTHVRNLRKKLKVTSPKIEAVRSIGFKLV